MYNLVVILVWFWEEVSMVFTYSAILIRTLFPQGCFLKTRWELGQGVPSG